MKGFLSLIFLLLSVTTSVSAWALTWTNSKGKSYVEQGHSPVNCRKIEQAKSEEYRWSPEEDGLSIWLFENDQCEGSRAGYSPPSQWEHISSRELLSFRVALADANENPTSTSTPTPTPTSTSTQTESATATASATPTGEPSGGSSVNSGAVAGGVVGGVAGAVAIGGLFFYLGRRKRSPKADPEPRESGPDNGNSTSRPSPPSPSAPPSAPAVPPSAVAGYSHYDASSYERKMELDSAPVYQSVGGGHHDETAKHSYSPLETSTPAHYPPARIISELPGDAGMVEMSDSHRLQELEARGTKMG
ncbi:uncharacterized protein APUU_10348A [Aspergillus puulaauensis]|uniref:Uncharacterized protein n=1 Tax=Aspergillus puulaauensis TaxID=1220207 RepID=A0A7R7XA93_9EURO|nr:uncharacterized protein APUU_10348A [Aspergillus puulaauensis]BCS17520.1 hypothetical protein APUU_10348A [Aspergillus puulaauensis]